MTEGSLPQSPPMPQDTLPVVLLLVVPHSFGQDIFPHIRMSNVAITGGAQIIHQHFQHLQKLAIT